MNLYAVCLAYKNRNKRIVTKQLHRSAMSKTSFVSLGVYLHRAYG